MKLFILLACCTLFGFAPNHAASQNSEITIDEDMVVTIDELFKIISDQTDYKFIYKVELFKDAPRVPLTKGVVKVSEILEKSLSAARVELEFKDNGTIIVKKKNDAPQMTVTGTVTDINGVSLEGVTVVLKGTRIGVTTNFDGEFEIQVLNPESALVFSYIGFKTEEVVVGNRNKINVTLKESVSVLDEVVVNAGYYKTSKRTATNSIAKVEVKDIEKLPITNPVAAIQGRAPGVFVQQTTGVPGGDFKLEIRGRNSLRSDGNQPLYVVDGVPFSTEKISGISGTVTNPIGNANPLTALNPADIESIEILKDADATAIYGSRGANGVVLITTKGGKVGKTRFTVNIYSGVSNIRLKKYLDTPQYLEMRRQAFANEGLIPSANPEDNTGSNGRGYAPDLTIWNPNRYTDWQKFFIGRNAYTNSVQTSLTGGNENTKFLVSAGYFNQSSVFYGDAKYQKLSTHFTLDHHSFDHRFSLNLSVLGSHDLNQQPLNDISAQAATLPPNAPSLFGEEGSLNWEPHPVTGQSTWSNPLAQFNNTYEGKVDNLVSNIVLGYEILPDLKIKTSVGLNRISSNEVTKLPSTRYDPALGIGSEQSVVMTSTGMTKSLIVEPQIDWQTKLSKGTLSTLIGGSYQEQNYSLLGNTYSDFPSNELLNNVASATNSSVSQNSISKYRYAAVYGRINYNWDGKYIVNATGRRDGSSRFGTGNRFANFGAIGVAWVFSDETFVKKVLPFMNYGKLRSSYGVTGSDQIGDYQYLDTYETPQGQNNQYDGVTGLEPTRIYNPYFGWESNKKFEGALELGFWENRVSFTAAYFNNRSSNQLVNYTLPRTTGFTGVLANLDATVQNTGLELELGTVNIQSDHLRWETSANISFLRNKLVSFPNFEASTYVNQYIIGESIYIQKFLEYTGVDPVTGYYTFKDYNNDGILSRPVDYQKPMLVGPDFFGGFTNSITYKNWSLDIFFQGAKQTGIATVFNQGSRQNIWLEQYYQEHWGIIGDVAETQRYATEYNTYATGLSGTAERYDQSDAVVGDASYIRLRSLMLSFQLPLDWTDQKCVVYAQGQNLWTLTNYKGSDPETQSTNLPPLRTLTIGVNMTF